MKSQKPVLIALIVFCVFTAVMGIVHVIKLLSNG